MTAHQQDQLPKARKQAGSRRGKWSLTSSSFSWLGSILAPRRTCELSMIVITVGLSPFQDSSESKKDIDTKECYMMLPIRCVCARFINAYPNQVQYSSVNAIDIPKTTIKPHPKNLPKETLLKSTATCKSNPSHRTAIRPSQLCNLSRVFRPPARTRFDNRAPLLRASLVSE